MPIFVDVPDKQPVIQLSPGRRHIPLILLNPEVLKCREMVPDNTPDLAVLRPLEVSADYL